MAIPWTNISNTSWLQSTSLPRTSVLNSNINTNINTNSNTNTNTEVMKILQFVLYGIIGEAMCVFGIASNTINIICFAKQGYKESINISLTALAISDFGCLITMVWTGLCFVPMFQELDLTFDPVDSQYLITGTPHIIFTRTTSSITALITLERCLCVMMPLKVKSMFTPTKVAFMNGCIFIIILITFLPIYFGVSMGMVYDSVRNRTVLGMIDQENRMLIEKVCFAINSVFFPATALLIILVCMSLMVIQLQKQTKWRQCHSGGRIDANAEREERLVKMIVMISTLFVVCFLPSVVILLLVTIEPEINVGGKYIHIAVFVYGFSTVAESTNSSMNIIIYHKMSGRYRAAFREIFSRQKETVVEGKRQKRSKRQ